MIIMFQVEAKYDGKDVIIKEDGGIYDKKGVKIGQLDGSFWSLFSSIKIQ